MPLQAILFLISGRFKQILGLTKIQSVLLSECTNVVLREQCSIIRGKMIPEDGIVLLKVDICTHDIP